MNSFITLRSNIRPMYCSSSSLDNLGPEDQFLACKHCQKVGHMLTTKISTTVQTGLIGMHKPVRPVWATLSKCQLDFTIAQLLSRRSKCRHRTSNLDSDERVMTSGRLDLDRTGQTGWLGQSDPSRQSSPSQELYFYMKLVRVSTPNGARPPLPINIKVHGRLRTSNRSNNLSFCGFTSQTLTSPIPICYSSCVSTAFEGVLSGLLTSEQL